LDRTLEYNVAIFAHEAVLSVASLVAPLVVSLRIRGDAVLAATGVVRLVVEPMLVVHVDDGVLLAIRVTLCVDDLRIVGRIETPRHHIAPAALASNKPSRPQENCLLAVVLSFAAVGKTAS